MIKFGNVRHFPSALGPFRSVLAVVSNRQSLADIRIKAHCPYNCGHVLAHISQDEIPYENADSWSCQIKESLKFRVFTLAMICHLGGLGRASFFFSNRRSLKLESIKFVHAKFFLVFPKSAYDTRL